MNGFYLNMAQPDERIFVASKSGVISTVNPSTYQVTGTYLDISARVLDSGEAGLLGLAFHPDFKTNGRFFVVSFRRSVNGQRTFFPGSKFLFALRVTRAILASTMTASGHVTAAVLGLAAATPPPISALVRSLLSA